MRKEVFNIEQNSTILFLLLALLSISVLLFSAKNQNIGDDIWAENHLMATSLEDAVQYFGDDLLLDHFFVSDSTKTPYTEFVLETSSPSIFNDRKTWTSLSIHINYSGERFKRTSDTITAVIFFHQDDLALDKESGDPLENGLLSQSSQQVKVNSVDVVYVNFESDFYKYASNARLLINDCLYDITCHSHTNANLLFDVLHQLLSDGEIL